MCPYCLSRKAKQAEDEKRKESEARAAKAEKSNKLWDRLRKEEEARRRAVAIEEEKRNAILAKLQVSTFTQYPKIVLLKYCHLYSVVYTVPTFSLWQLVFIQWQRF
jgi:hypothetical protein